MRTVETIRSRQEPRSEKPKISRKNHRFDIQGLRAVAVLMVVAFHANFFTPGGFVGVDVFFVISGFVITAMMMREWGRSGTIRLGRFYVRRFKRLAPALAVLISVVMAAGALLLSPFGGQQVAAKTALGALLLGSNFVIARTTGGYFDAPADNNPLLNLWSLSIEEQFYLVFPALMLGGWALARRRFPHRGPVTVIGMLGGISLALALAVSAGWSAAWMPDDLVGFYGTATRVWEFAAGALLALGGSKLAVHNRRLAALFGCLGAAMLLASLWLIDGSSLFPGVWTLLPVAGTVLLIAAGATQTFVTRLLSSSPLVWIGDRSYSIYLWHWPMIVFARINISNAVPVLALAGLLSFIPAAASYRWVEEPIRAMELTSRKTFARLVAATIALPLGLTALLAVAASKSFWSPQLQEQQEAISADHTINRVRCTGATARNDLDRCTWNEDASGEPVYLVGDSNADHLSEALIGASRSLDRPLVALPEHGCSFVSGSSSLANANWRKRCDRYVQEASEQLEEAEDGLVVISNAYGDFRAHFDGKRSERISMAGEPQVTPLYSRLMETVEPLQDAGHDVLLVQTVPHWGIGASLDWQKCSMLKLQLGACERDITLSEVENRQGDIADAVEEVARDSGAGWIALDRDVCPDGNCSAVSAEGMIRYKDGVHITVDQSRVLTKRFERKITAVEQDDPGSG